MYFADFLRASTGCIGTPDPIDPIAIGPAEGADPILVIGTTGDSRYPYEWAVEMADLLSSGVLYTVEAEGHTAFLLRAVRRRRGHRLPRPPRTPGRRVIVFG